MSVEIDTQEIVDRINGAFGDPERGSTDAGFYNGDRDLYPFIAVVKGGDFDVSYDGFDKFDEAAEYAQATAYDSLADSDGEGIWMVVAIVNTKTCEVHYPSVSVFTSPDSDGNLSDWGV
jgi:hypothetical protein